MQTNAIKDSVSSSPDLERLTLPPAELSKTVRLPSAESTEPLSNSIRPVEAEAKPSRETSSKDQAAVNMEEVYRRWSTFEEPDGMDATALYNEHAPTPAIAALAKDGLLLERHYVFRYCSPSRRSFLSGRFPTSITSVQPDGDRLCSDFLPLATTTLAEKLRDGAGYECHFIGKGHLGYETTDHLPVRRGLSLIHI